MIENWEGHDGGEALMTWRGVDKALADCVEGSNYLKHMKTIVGISRGGLPIATILAHLLKVDLVLSVAAQSYDADNKQRMLNITAAPDPVRFNIDTTVIVDDIADTGATMSALSQIYPKAYRFALVAKPQGASFLHEWGIPCQQNTWIVFPWESKPEKEGRPSREEEERPPS